MDEFKYKLMSRIFTYSELIKVLFLKKKKNNNLKLKRNYLFKKIIKSKWKNLLIDCQKSN